MRLISVSLLVAISSLRVCAEVILYETYDGTNTGLTDISIAYQEPDGGHRMSSGPFFTSDPNLSVTRLVLFIGLVEGQSEDLRVSLYTGITPTVAVASFFASTSIAIQGNYTFYPTQTVILAEGVFYSVVAEPATIPSTVFSWREGTNFPVGARESFGGNPEWSPWSVSGDAPTVRVFADVVPEPATWLLMSIGVVGAYARRLINRTTRAVDAPPIKNYRSP